MTEHHEIQTVAREFLGAESWREMLPLVAEAEQVKDLMEWHYSIRGFQPVSGEVTVESVTPLETEGRQLRRVQAATAGRAAIWLLLVREGDAWKVDWEVFSNAAVARWRAFVRDRAGASVELPVLAALKPAADSYVVSTGAAPGRHTAVVLWALDRQSLAGAVLPNDSPLWRDLADIGFDRAVKVIARVTMLDPHAEPPLVRLDRIAQRNWIRRKRQ